MYVLLSINREEKVGGKRNMAFIQCDFFSEVLQISTSMNVLIPQQTKSQIGLQTNTRSEKHPTLYLLHGLSDDHTIWMRRTSIERYASELGLAVVMPNVDRSFYRDMAYGKKYWTFVTEELPQLARSFFPLSEKREDNFVAGLSMGGYGALKWAFRKPHQFSAAASLSGVMDVEGLEGRGEVQLLDYPLIFGLPPVIRPEDDLFWLLENRRRYGEVTPRIYQCCGTEDFLYQENKRFSERCKQEPICFTYEEGKGSHDWAYWDHKIQDVLKWLFSEK